MKLFPFLLASFLVAALLIVPVYGWMQADHPPATPQSVIEPSLVNTALISLTAPVLDPGGNQNHSPMTAPVAALPFTEPLTKAVPPLAAPTHGGKMSRPRLKPSTPFAPIMAAGMDALPGLHLPGIPLKTALPPASRAFPTRLQTVPILSRAVSTETVAYLAAHEIRYPSKSIPYVALTFDCESGVENTRQILKTLRQEDSGKAPIRITFFLMGQYALKYPDIVREIVADGHELGNHSFDHPKFTTLTQVTVTQQISYTEAAINLALGYPLSMRYFRFPYGLREAEHLTQIAELGYQSVLWNLDPRGWEKDRTAEDVVEYMRQTVRPGGIVVMHCACWNDVNALPEIIRIVHDKGLQVGTISDLVNYQATVSGMTP